jgi:outer membrane autotransporter protein
VYDPGAFYVKAVGTYSWFDGDSDRNINFAGLAPGATFNANVSGDPDVKMWTFGLHGGARMSLGGNSVLTPYLNYDYVNARMREFIEGGTSGASLHLDDNSAKHSFLTGGVKWATQMGGVVPEVNLGYRYRFGDKRTNITQAFLCQTDTCAFDVESAGQKRGNFLAGLSVGGKMGPVDLRIGYEGEFNSDITSHSGNFKFVLPLGGRAAPPPPPPPAPVIAPPPPPPVEVAPPPPPPPPPPAPVERGERGQ